MRKVLVFQHVAHKILGTLNPTLKEHGLNMRYVNFEREPNAQPSVEKYNGLIILGGHMGVYEADKYKHIKVEAKLIEDALKKEIPVLGICLGSQILAHVLGSPVRKHEEKEIGWHDVYLTKNGLTDPLFKEFKQREKVFQLHGDTFDIPSSCVHLAESSVCSAQAFRYGDKVYGLQFHLEVDGPMILRWLDHPANKKDIEESGKYSLEAIREETKEHLERSMELSKETFSTFIELFGLPQRPIRLGSHHIISKGPQKAKF
jgi:GMP synthase (glutamine-hydrolysing)